MMQPPVVQSCATTMVNASFAWTVGVLASRAWLEQGGDVRPGNVRAKLSSSMGIGIVVCIAASLFSLWQAAASMADVGLLEIDITLWRVFAATHYGMTGLTGLGLLMLAAIVSIAGSKGILKRQDLLVASLLGLHAASRVTLGHAFEYGPFSTAVLVEWAHLMFMALWVGTVMTAAWVVLPYFGTARTMSRLPSAYLASVSTWSTVALTGIVATGVFNTYRVLAHPAELVTTGYGWVLTTKLAFVAVAIGLGAYNRFVGFPMASGRWQEAGGQNLRSVTLVMRIESIVLLLVLGAAAVLAESAPPHAT